MAMVSVGCCLAQLRSSLTIMFVGRLITCKAVRHMSFSSWDDGSDSDRLRGVYRVRWLVGHCKIPAWQRAKLPRYGREGAVEVRPFPAKKRLRVSEAQGLSGEAVKGNPTTTAILRVDESKSGLQNKPKT